MRRAGGEFLFVKLDKKDHIYGAGYAMTEALPFTQWFLDEYILSGKGRQVVFEISKEF